MNSENFETIEGLCEELTASYTAIEECLDELKPRTRYEYNMAQERKRKWRDRIVNAVTLIIFFAVYIIAGVLEP